MVLIAISCFSEQKALRTFPVFRPSDLWLLNCLASSETFVADWGLGTYLISQVDWRYDLFKLDILYVSK